MDSGTLLSDRYRLDRRIDSGAMGEVWRARDELLKRDVAVKILLHGVDGAGKRFKREAETLASLKGGNYVEVYDFGEELDGDRTVQFLVMELVEGDSLARVLAREERLDPERTMRIIAETADALGAAHRLGVVHRDVKPANLLIDADDRVRVVDFGISLLVNESRMTDSTELLGTVPYVSPERLRNQDVTGSSDLYSLGAVAYECLTGTPPFPARDPMAVIHSHLYEEPPPLPDSIPPQIASVVHRSLRKAPDERWESGEAFAAACRTAVTGEITVPPPAPEPEREPGRAADPGAVEDRPRSRKRLALLTTAIATVVALVAVVLWGSWAGDSPTGPGADAGDGSTAEAAAEGVETPSATGSPEPSASATESPVAEESESTAEGGGEEGGAEVDDEDTEGVNSGPDHQPAASSGEVPDVTGMTTFAARDYLAELGFTNTVASVGYYWYTPEPEHCTVMQQSPTPGSQADHTDRITLSYHERQAEGTTCEW
ncbi:serine/threonine protein kinase [Glycomyces albidus]|uniref:non-specific serine/threonine protein kinase n=1 Tax=Glycomyces albidus TaxID=2656774 RepID=A0A6L5G4N9_9ACTN|nr:serine/threonine protein kinase [Glycomyces albidus]MQM24592.1 protein kinase [Glycomyces albidus]